MSELDNNEELLSDDLAPNSADMLFTEELEEEVQQQNNHDRAMIHGALPLLDTLFKWFDVQIQNADSISSINPESKVPIEVQILAKKELKAKLVQVKMSLEIMKETHVK